MSITFSSLFWISINLTSSYRALICNSEPSCSITFTKVISLSISYNKKLVRSVPQLHEEVIILTLTFSIPPLSWILLTNCSVVLFFSSLTVEVTPSLLLKQTFILNYKTFNHLTSSVNRFCQPLNNSLKMMNGWDFHDHRSRFSWWTVEIFMINSHSFHEDKVEIFMMTGPKLLIASAKIP